MSKAVLPTIVITQFLCTSLWFAGNAVMPDLIREMGVAPQFLAQATSAVQLGFVAGTLVFALLSLSDRFVATKVYFLSAVIASVFNLGLLFTLIDSKTIFVLRFGTGFFLAGIYPVGMKIAADHFKEKLGAVLGWLWVLLYWVPHFRIWLNPLCRPFPGNGYLLVHLPWPFWADY